MEARVFLFPTFPQVEAMHAKNIQIAITQIGKEFVAGHSHIYVDAADKNALTVVAKIAKQESEEKQPPSGARLVSFVCKFDPDKILIRLRNEYGVSVNFD